MTIMKSMSSLPDNSSGIPVTAMLRNDVTDWCRAQSIPAYRAEQIWQWLYRKGASSYDEMSNIPLALRVTLAEKLPLTKTRIAHTHTAKDTSVKYIIELEDSACVECVWIPMGSHSTVCVSTQVGCPVQCIFCASGAHGLHRNLATYEIVEQVVHIMRQHGRDSIGNIVFMGTGEPFYNANAFFTATAILNNTHGLCIGMRRMTVSTVGVIAGITRLSHDAPQMNLAVSLHAAHDTLRKKLIPHCPSSLKELMNALKSYYAQTHRRITFEYVLLHGINDSKKDMHALAEYVSDVPSKVNLIAYNPVPGSPYQPPSPKQCEDACEELNACYVTATVRRRKGDDVNAACGQLRSQFIP